MANNIIIQFSETEFKALLQKTVRDEILEIKVFLENTSQEKLLTIKEAASFLNLAQQTIYAFTSQRSIPFIKKGKRLYFKKLDLQKWMEEGAKPTVNQINSNLLSNQKGGYHG